MDAPSFADATNLEIASDEPELIELAPGETSLRFLQKIYRSPKQPMSRRLRAAMRRCRMSIRGLALSPPRA
jgi:hypothetical protein